MCHECDDEDGEVQFNPEYINELQALPPDMKEEVIGELAGYISHIMERAEEQGFLFELITSWPRQKVAMYEAAVIMEKNILDDDHEH